MAISPTEEKKLVNRSDRVAFMEVDIGGTKKYVRMTEFTAMTNAKNPKEYSRHYVDERSERSDVVGYAPSTEYSFDRTTNTPVHNAIAKIHDGEAIGTDSHVNIVVVDLFDVASDNKYMARKRTYSVIPSQDGEGTDALIYSGAFKSVSEIIPGTASTTDEWKTLTFTAI